MDIEPYWPKDWQYSSQFEFVDWPQIVLDIVDPTETKLFLWQSPRVVIWL
ncbi:hypothetical protein [Neorhizobium sp. NCHU2750]